MPTISMFYGIIIRIYCAPGEHNPPHFHAYYQDYKAIFDIQKCELIDGNLPKKQTRLVLAWAELHKDELMQTGNWHQKASYLLKLNPLNKGGNYVYWN